MYGNKFPGLTSGTAVNIGPVLLSFDLNMNSGSISVYFSESVFGNFTCMGFTLQSNQSVPATLYNLTTNVLVTNDLSSSTKFTSVLSEEDLNMLKILQIGLSIPSCYLSVIPDITYSISPNALVPHAYSHKISTTDALQVDSLTLDVVPPVCLSFGLDLNQGLLVLFFNEPVDLNTLVTTSITLYASNGGNALQLGVPLSVERTNLTAVSVALQDSDLNAVKLANILHPYDLMLFTTNMVRDMSGNVILGVSLQNPIQLSYFVPDTTPPQLLSFALDYNTNLLTLHFNEVVNTSSIDPSNIQLLSSKNVSTASSFTLTYYSLVIPSTSDDVVVDMNLYRYDALALEADPFIGQSIQQVFARVGEVRDVSGNVLIMSTIASCTSLIKDTSTTPMLESFAWSPFNNSGVPITLVLYFSRVINGSTFACSDFIVQSDGTSSPAESLPIMNNLCSFNASINSRAVIITLSPTFLNNVQLVGTSQTTTFIATVPSPITKGISGNALQRLNAPIEAGPTISEVLLDMVRGTCTVLFSAPIDRSSFASSAVGFYSSTSSSFFYLTNAIQGINGINAASPNVDSVGIIEISASDLITLKLLKVQPQAMYLLIKSSAFVDEYGESNIVIDLNNKFPIAQIIVDNVPPVIQGIQLDMGGQSILFTFDEPVLTSSVDTSKITIQAGPSSQNFVTLSRVPLTSIVGFRNTMAISLTINDDALIKLNQDLAKNISTSYVSISFDCMTDLANNYLNEIPFSQPLQVTAYKADLTPPSLYRFDMNVQVGTMLFYFNEPIVLSSFNTSLLFIQSRIRLSDGVIEFN